MMRKKVFFLAFLVGGIYLIVVFTRDLWRVLSSRNRVVEAEDKVTRLQERQVELEKELTEVESEGFVEREARDKLLLAKEGEVVVLIPEEQIAEYKLQLASDNSGEELANWEKWVRVFGF